MGGEGGGSESQKTKKKAIGQNSIYFQTDSNSGMKSRNHLNGR